MVVFFNIIVWSNVNPGHTIPLTLYLSTSNNQTSMHPIHFIRSTDWISLKSVLTIYEFYSTKSESNMQHHVWTRERITPDSHWCQQTIKLFFMFWPIEEWADFSLSRKVCLRLRWMLYFQIKKFAIGNEPYASTLDFLDWTWSCQSMEDFSAAHFKFALSCKRICMDCYPLNHDRLHRPVFLANRDGLECVENLKTSLDNTKCGRIII